MPYEEKMSSRRVGTPPVHTSLLSPLLKHLFVGDVPLLYSEKGVTKQVQIELWLGTLTLNCHDLKLREFRTYRDRTQEYVV